MILAYKLNHRKNSSQIETIFNSFVLTHLKKYTEIQLDGKSCIFSVLMNSLLGTHSWNPFPNPFLVKRTLVIMSTSMQCCFGQ